MRYSYNPPGIIKSLFRDFIWESKTQKVLLTFDDGPQAETTNIILSKLNKLKLKAVFFCVGNNVSQNLSLVQEILSEGHAIGNHTWSHKKVTLFSAEDYYKEIEYFSRFVKEKLDYTVKWFRPPHGRFDTQLKNQLELINLKNVMWSLLTYDYKNDLKVVKFAVQKYSNANSIIVFHDSIKSIDIIEDSIQLTYDTVMEKGFTFGDEKDCLN